MLSSIAYIFILGLAAAYLCSLIRIPRIIGMLIVGVLMGPHCFGLLDSTILGISADLRQMALIIILLKAGLTLDVKDLKRIGRPALLMSFLPAVFEILAFVAFGPAVLGVSLSEAAIIGAVLGAVSPAVVVPRMVQLIEEKRGTEKGIPQMILAGASLDDVFVIVLFSTFVSMEQGGSLSAMSLLSIPVKIVLGIVLGIAVGYVLGKGFVWMFDHGHKVRTSIKVIVMLAVAFLLVSLENTLEGIVPVSGLLAVMSMACAIKQVCPEKVSGLLARKYGRLWLGAEVLLFVLVGAAVDVGYSLQAGPVVILMLLLGLAIRSIGVTISMLGTKLNWKERLFCVISYLPKATVQAAIGGIPLALGLPCGNLVLTIAVVSIIVTAPIGAFGMDLTYRKLLEQN